MHSLPLSFSRDASRSRDAASIAGAPDEGGPFAVEDMLGGRTEVVVEAAVSLEIGRDERGGGRVEAAKAFGAGRVVSSEAA
jgi:hypothetical protein